MKFPISWVSEFVKLPEGLDSDSISQALVGVGFEVEGVQNLAKEINGPIKFGKVISIEEITEYKKPIRWVSVDVGEIRNVICGAQNFKVGDHVVVALPGALLPGPFPITARETYGRTSDGMICSARELGMGDDHTGILVMDEQDSPIGSDAIVALGLNEMIFDVAINPDRGYAMSIRGIARELATAFKVDFQDPASLVEVNDVKDLSGPIKVSINEGADRIHLRSVSEVNADAKPPLWMVRRLQMCGMRSISIAVDVTNYVMIELGQPLHAFDSDRIKGSITVRLANEIKTIKTLDEQDRELFPENLLIADDSGALAIAGTMGGFESEVTSKTKAITIEAAHFDPVLIAKNARSHKLSTEASRRFERGVDPLLTHIASMRAVNLLVKYTGAKYIGFNSVDNLKPAQKIEFDPQAPSKVIGGKYSNDVVSAALIAIGCEINENKKELWQVTRPSWRPDLNASIDLVEEVARLNGYENIPSILPTSPLSRGLTPAQRRRRRVVQLLANRGLTEVQSYPFVSAETISIMGFTGDRAKSYRLANPISEQEPFLRTHLVPGLIQTGLKNFSRGVRSLGIFEIGNIYRAINEPSNSPVIGVDAKPSAEEIAKLLAHVPKQPLCIGGFFAGAIERESWWGKGRNFDWSDATEAAVEVVRSCGWEPTIHASDFAPWHPGRCAELRVNGTMVGHSGELHPRVISALGLPERAGAFMVNLDAIPYPESVKAKTITTMVPTIQDVALIVKSEVVLADLTSALIQGAGELLEKIELFDRYQGAGVPEGQVSYAFTLTFRAADRTLTAEEVAGYRASAIESANKACGAVLRG